MNPLKVIIFTESQSSFLARKSQIIALDAEVEPLWGDSSRFSRQDLINQNLGSHLFFLDHDCLPDHEELIFARNWFEQMKNTDCVVGAGLYRNPKTPTLLQSTHNFIANSWLESSYEPGSSAGLLLGGVFLLKGTIAIAAPALRYWGAEDKALALQLAGVGYHMSLCRNLTVRHETNSSFRHFIKRAWMHGMNESKIGKKKKLRLNITYWLQKAGLADLKLMPLVLLHFCIQKAALLFQKLRQENK